MTVYRIDNIKIKIKKRKMVCYVNNEYLFSAWKGSRIDENAINVKIYSNGKDYHVVLNGFGNYTHTDYGEENGRGSKAFLRIYLKEMRELINAISKILEEKSEYKNIKKVIRIVKSVHNKLEKYEAQLYFFGEIKI